MEDFSASAPDRMFSGRTPTVALNAIHAEFTQRGTVSLLLHRIRNDGDVKRMGCITDNLYQEPWLFCLWQFALCSLRQS